MGGHEDIIGAAPRTLDVIERALFDDPPLELGRFEILRCLGRGGMGVVYLAMDPTLKCEVAIKLHHGGSLDSGERRLRREAESLAHLRHRNVVTVHEVGCSDTGELFIVMQYVPGPTLRAWVHCESPSPKQLLSVFARCAEGLHAAHRVGLVHRDFKPDNVIIDRDGEPIIIAPRREHGAEQSGYRTSAGGSSGRSTDALHRSARHPARNSGRGACGGWRDAREPRQHRPLCGRDRASILADNISNIGRFTMDDQAIYFWSSSGLAKLAK